jgi:predicted enzyme related to lactoylglutathione lyase
MADRPDPFTALHRPVPSIRPRPQFVIELRRRLQEELTMPDHDDDHVEYDDHGALGLVHLRVADADRAMAFFGAAFGWVGERYDGDGHVSHYVTNTAVTVRLWDDPDRAPLRPNYRVRHVGDAVRAIEAAGGRITESDLQGDGGGWAYADDRAGLPLLVYRPSSYPSGPASDAVRGDVGLVFLVEGEEEASAFYGPVLGWQLQGGHAGSRYFDTVPRVGVFDEEGAMPSITFFLEVPDLSAASVDVRRLGGTADDPPAEPDMGPYFSVRCTDDQGTAFGLLSSRRG